MVDMQVLYKTVDEMKPDEIADLLDYLLADKSFAMTEEPSQERILGLHAHLGKALMSDDFNQLKAEGNWDDCSA